MGYFFTTTQSGTVLLIALYVLSMAAGEAIGATYVTNGKGSVELDNVTFNSLCLNGKALFYFSHYLTTNV
jgi:hypothetical protein